jgi:hypothetical protein
VTNPETPAKHAPRGQPPDTVRSVVPTVAADRTPSPAPGVTAVVTALTRPIALSAVSLHLPHFGARNFAVSVRLSYIRFATRTLDWQFLTKSFPVGSLTLHTGSSGSSENVVSRLWAGRTGFSSRHTQGFFSSAPRPYLGHTGPPIEELLEAVTAGQSSRDVKLITHFCLVPKLRIRGVKPPVSQPFLWRGT